MTCSTYITTSDNYVKSNHEQLLLYFWVGNASELKNLAERTL